MTSGQLVKKIPVLICVIGLVFVAGKLWVVRHPPPPTTRSAWDTPTLRTNPTR
jgi:hypothetical protein